MAVKYPWPKDIEIPQIQNTGYLHTKLKPGSFFERTLIHIHSLTKLQMQNAH